MADHDRDEKLSRRYGELAREEPPRAIDDAILAAARREVESHPAPLVAPSGRRRWYVPVAAAAVIVLSAVVTLHMQHERPDWELGAPQIASAPTARKDEAPAAAPPVQMREERPAEQAKEAEAPRPPAYAAKPKPERRQRQSAPEPKLAAPSRPPAGEAAAIARSEPRAAAESERFSQDPTPVAAAPPVPAAVQMRPATPASKPAAGAADIASGMAASAPGVEQSRALGGLRDSPMLAKREPQAEPPEKMLERIAALRREGRAREADDLYAEFKRRFPDYRIPDAMREQVLPR